MTTIRVLAMCVVAAGLGARPVPAATFTVNDTADRAEATPGDGVCDTDPLAAGEQCTLRAAVQEANANAESDVIIVPAGTYALTLKGAGEDQAASGDLDLTGLGASIEGAGATTTIIDGKKLKDRLFHVHSVAVAEIRGLTLQRGKAPKTEDEGGGCIRNQGTLTIRDAVVTTCKAKDDAGALDGQFGTLFVERTTFAKNKTKDDGGAVDVDGGSAGFLDVVFTGNKAGDEGGALENSGGTVTLTNVTFEANKAKKEGGGVSNEDGGQLDFVGCSLTGNKAKKGGAVTTSTDVEFGVSVTRAQGTTFSDNKKRNCDGPVVDLGGNTDSDGSCQLGAQ